MRDVVQERRVDVIGAFQALLLVEELDVVPRLLLVARGERGCLLRREDVGVGAVRGRCRQRAVDQLDLPGADVVGDELLPGALGELLADRALQVGKLGHDYLRVR